MIYHRTIPVEFNHCDPAGIVFYPRYFEMTNSVVENFFAEVAGQSYAVMMSAGQGVPTAKLEVNFLLPSRLGDRLDWRLTVERLGGSSIRFQLQAHSGAEHRLTADLVLVWVEAGRPQPWPASIRTAITTFMEAI
ncbi:MAG: thioesterase family protein [Pseudomonadota bacterium]